MKGMKRIAVAVFLAVLTSAFLVWAQVPNSAPKPNPEINKLAVYVGQWSYQGEYSQEMSGAAGKVTGDASSEMILGGHFLEWRWRERGATGETRGFEILRYDPVNKTYPSQAFGDDGSSMSGEYTIEKNVSRFSGKSTVAGKQQLIRVTEAFSADLMSFTQKIEVSEDGMTWGLLFEGKFIKVGSVPQKVN